MSETGKTAGRSSASVGLSEVEKAAMQESIRERRTAARRASGAEKGDGLADVRAKIAEMAPPDRAMAERIHEIVMAAAPDLAPRTWYGMPAYAKDGKVICFFQAASKFKVRYATLGFQPDAHLDEGTMWPSAFALIALSAEDEARIAALVRQAVG